MSCRFTMSRNKLLAKRFLHLGRRRFSVVVTHEDLKQEVRPYEDIPGPRPIPILGNKFRFIPGFQTYDFSDLLKFNKKLYDEYGPIVKFSGLEPNNDLVFVFNPQDIETVFRSDSQWPFRPPLKSLAYYRKHTRKDFFKGVGGVLIDQGKEWQEARHHVNPILMQTKVVQMYAPKIDQVAEEFVAKIPGWIDSKDEILDDFKNEMHKWALESIAVVALDTRLGCLADKLDPNSEPQRMIDSVHTLLEVLHNLEFGGEAFLWRIYPSPSWRKFVKVMDFFTDVSYKYVQQAIERSKSRPEGTEPSALERLLARDPNPTRGVIMALDMLMAGIDTTSHSLTNVMLHLSENQDKQEKLHQELQRISPDPYQPITNEMLNEMKYLKACIKESMRMMPVVTSNIRMTTSEIVLSNYRVPAGVDVLMATGAMSRFKEHYNEPDKFLPERWIRGGEQEEKANPFVTLPFGHGARKCIGMRFAQLELEIALAKMMRRFRWEFKYGPMEYKSTLVHAPVKPLKFTIFKR
ncbi:probable cytochrome P450 301a1, mitochondrial [Neocloeon triangulifer]|uniref:probable cytochrome P450 301a1, mitochondrial n=1 Tax=Neocloeon triangulifer TaxID=2078957 RepID=UPI00286F5677|nr:probable cytochrome P450 301a1, mitochondrial [Neocloeon triangulifer]